MAKSFEILEARLMHELYQIRSTLKAMELPHHLRNSEYNHNMFTHPQPPYYPPVHNYPVNNYYAHPTVPIPPQNNQQFISYNEPVKSINRVADEIPPSPSVVQVQPLQSLSNTAPTSLPEIVTTTPSATTTTLATTTEKALQFKPVKTKSLPMTKLLRPKMQK